METSIFDIAHLVRITTPEHLVDEVIVVGRIVTRTELFKLLPMFGKNLFEDIPAGKDLGSHGSTSRWGVVEPRWITPGLLKPPRHRVLSQASSLSDPTPAKNFVSSPGKLSMMEPDALAILETF